MAFLVTTQTKAEDSLGVSVGTDVNVKTQTKMQTAHVGYNETKKRLVRVTISLAFNPNNLTRLWELKERGLKATQRLAEAGLREDEELFD